MASFSSGYVIILILVLLAFLISLAASIFSVIGLVKIRDNQSSIVSYNTAYNLTLVGVVASMLNSLLLFFLLFIPAIMLFRKVEAIYNEDHSGLHTATYIGLALCVLLSLICSAFIYLGASYVNNSQHSSIYNWLVIAGSLNIVIPFIAVFVILIMAISIEGSALAEIKEKRALLYQTYDFLDPNTEQKQTQQQLYTKIHENLKGYVDPSLDPSTVQFAPTA